MEAEAAEAEEGEAAAASEAEEEAAASEAEEEEAEEGEAAAEGRTGPIQNGARRSWPRCTRTASRRCTWTSR